MIRTGATQAAPILRMGVPEAQLAPILRMRAPVLPAPRASLPDVRAHPEFAPARELGSCGSRTRDDFVSAALSAALWEVYPKCVQTL